MRETRDAFHLAIPALDLDEAYEFYVTGLGCKLARRYNDRITLDFFGDQVVCHLSETRRPARRPVSAALRGHIPRTRRLGSAARSWPSAASCRSSPSRS